MYYIIVEWMAFMPSGPERRPANATFFDDIHRHTIINIHVRSGTGRAHRFFH